jgi:DNA-binding GntR family transcriptional regulator
VLNVAATKVDEIALILENAIVSGELAPGTVLRQDQLSEEFGVSRTPVREALRQVAAVGLVSLEANRGARVRSLSPEELAETFVIRAELEGLAAELALPLMTRSDLSDLRAAERQFADVTRQLQARKDAELAVASRWLTIEWVAANGEFHDVILRAARSPLLARMAKSVRRVFLGQIVWANSPEVNELYDVNLSQHREIVAAFTRRDPAVRQLVSEHVGDSGRLLDVVLSKASQRRGPLLGSAPSHLVRSAD